MLQRLILSITGILLAIQGMPCSADEAPKDPALAVWWSFDTANSLVVRDLSGHGNDGEIKGAELEDTDVGKSLKFDGANACLISINMQNTDITEELSYEILAKYTGKRGMIYFLNRDNRAALWGDEKNGTVGWRALGQRGGWLFSLDSSGCLSANEWHHIVGTFSHNLGMAKLYVDGICVKEQAGITDTLAKTTAQVKAGEKHIYNYQGFINEARIYKKALNEQEIKEHYRAFNKERRKKLDDYTLIKKLGYPYYTGEIIPKPKDVKYYNDFICLSDFSKNKNYTCLLLYSNASRQEELAAKKLQSRLNSIFKQAGVDDNIRILRDSDDCSAYKVVISLGTPVENKINANFLSQEKLAVTPQYPGKEGYVLLFANNADKEMVICCGSDNVGSYYAIQSLLQLMTIKDHKLLIRKARIIDWPTCQERNSAGGSAGFPVVADWMGAYKINGFFINNRGAQPWYSSPLALKCHEAFCNYANETGIFKIIYHINPYMSYTTPHRQIKISDDKDITALADNYRRLLKGGVRKIFLNTEDAIPAQKQEFILPFEEDKKKFGDLAAAHIYLANTIYNMLSKEYPDLEMYFVPTYYCTGHVNNWARTPEIAKAYLLKIGTGLSPKIRIVFTGPTIDSAVITERDVKEINSFFGGRSWYLWDNSIILYALGAVCDNVTGGTLKPFSTQYPPGFEKQIIVHSNSVCNTSNPYEELLKIYAVTACDYMWNPEHYDAKWSLRQAIESYTGTGTAEPLIKFGDFYDKVKEDIILLNETIEPEKILLTDSFEELESDEKRGAVSWKHEPCMKTHIEREDSPDGKQCMVTTTSIASTLKDKGYFLWTGNFAVDIPSPDCSNLAVEFFWKTDDPNVALTIYLRERKTNREGAHVIDIKAPNTGWNSYCIPFSEFRKGKMERNIIGGLMFWRGISGKDVTFKLDRIRIIQVPNSIARRERERRLETLNELEICFEEIKKKCLNVRLAEYLEKMLYSQKIRLEAASGSMTERQR